MKRYLKLAGLVATDSRSDRELLTSYSATRDSDVLAELFRRHSPAIRAVAADVCSAAADDVVQATFLLFTQRVSSLSGRDSAAGWLFHVARRLALKARTAAARRTRHEASGPSPAPTPSPLDDLAFREVRAVVAEELSKIPEHLRVVLVLHYWEGAAHAEAANRLGCSVSTLKRQLEVGRERLGSRLARRGLAGASVLTALTALHAQATARPFPSAQLDEGLTLLVTASDASPSAELLRTTSGVGSAKSGLAACVLVVGVGLAFGLSPRSEPVPSDPARLGNQPPPMITPRAKPDAPQAILPSGAVSIFGADNLHHGDIIGRVFVTPDGRHAVSLGSADHTPEDRIRTKLWDLETGKALVLAGGKLPAVPGGVKVVAAAPVGKSLALVVVPQDRIKAGEAGWWFIDAISGEVLAEFPRTTVWGRSDIDPVGNRIATVTAHGKQPNDPQEYKVLLWEVGKKQEPTELLPPQRHRVHKIQFAPDGRHLAVQYADGTQLEILDATTRKVVLAVPDSDPTGRTFDCFAFSPDGRLFAKEDQNNKTLRVWTLADGKERPAFLCEDGNWGHPVVFDSTGTHLGHLSTRGKFQLYSLATGELVWEVPCKGGFLTGFDAAFTSDGMWLVTAEREDLVVRDAKTGKVRDTANHTADISHLAWSRDGKRVVTLDGDSGTLGRVWNAESGRQAATIAGHADRYAALAASPDESVFATSGARSRRDAGDTSVRLWSAADGREIASFQPKLENTEFGVRHLWFAPDGKTLFGLARELGFVWDVSGKRELRSFAHPFAYVSGAYPLAGGQRVLLCGWLPHADGSPTSVTEDPLIVLTMDLKTGNEIGPRVDFGRDGLRGASWDGRFVIRTWYASPSDHRAEVWDLTGACSLGRLSGSNGSESPWVTTGLFSPNARTFSVGYSDGTVRVYEWATRTECLRFSHGASVQSLAYSPDGSRLASTGSRWGLVWDLTAPQVMKPASDTDAWSALAKNDGRSGLAAARYWAERPAEAVPYFTSRLRPVPAVDPKKVADWIEQLGSESFAEREAATKQLSGVGDAARHQFSAAIAKLESPEARNRLATIAAALGDDRPLTGDLLRAVRTVELLETFETPQAREVLKALAGGAPDARLTRSAAAALTRLKNRK